MKSAGTAAFAAAFFAVAAAAAATAPTTTQPISPTNAVKLMMWLDGQTIASSPQPEGLIFMNGAVVPSTVMLYAVPASAGVASATKYRYAKIGDRVVLVDPTTHKIVYLIS